MSETENQSTGIIKVSPGLLGALATGGISLSVLPREVLCLHCVVSGTSFRKLDTVEPSLDKKVKLDVVREPRNEYDEFAVALLFGDQKVGYIPRTKNETIARLMDAGKSFFAVIQAKEWEGNWLRIEVEVFLKD